MFSNFAMLGESILCSSYALLTAVSSATVARDLSDKELIEMLQKKPRYVPQLQVHGGVGIRGGTSG